MSSSTLSTPSIPSPSQTESDSSVPSPDVSAFMSGYCTAPSPSTFCLVAGQDNVESESSSFDSPSAPRFRIVELENERPVSLLMSSLHKPYETDKEKWTRGHGGLGGSAARDASFFNSIWDVPTDLIAMCAGVDGKDIVKSGSSPYTRETSDRAITGLPARQELTPSEDGNPGPSVADVDISHRHSFPSLRTAQGHPSWFSNEELISEALRYQDISAVGHPESTFNGRFPEPGPARTSLSYPQIHPRPSLSDRTLPVTAASLSALGNGSYPQSHDPQQQPHQQLQQQQQHYYQDPGVEQGLGASTSSARSSSGHQSSSLSAARRTSTPGAWSEEAVRRPAFGRRARTIEELQLHMDGMPDSSLHGRSRSHAMVPSHSSLGLSIDQQHPQTYVSDPTSSGLSSYPQPPQGELLDPLLAFDPSANTGGPSPSQQHLPDWSLMGLFGSGGGGGTGGGNVAPGASSSNPGMYTQPGYQQRRVGPSSSFSSSNSGWSEDLGARQVFGGAQRPRQPPFPPTSPPANSVPFITTTEIVLRATPGLSSEDVPYDKDFELKPARGLASEPPASDFDVVSDDDEAKPHLQTDKLRFPGDLYTPRWVRYSGNAREAWCDKCEHGGWFQLKNSQWWYHCQSE